MTLLSQRLGCFSQREPPYEDLAQLCEDELAQIIGDELVALASGSPRVALVLADLLLQSHCRGPEPSDLIAISSWQHAKQIWRSHRSDFAVTDGDPDEQPREATPTAFADPRILVRPVLFVDEEKHLVRLGKDDITCKLGARDQHVLMCLYRHRDRVCSKDLLTEMWPEAEASGVRDQAIAVSISRLRRALHEHQPDAMYIETVRGRGYRLHPEGFEP